MNEKKAIVFFFVVVVFFFCFSFLLLLVVVVASSTYVTYVFLSFVLCFGCVCVFFFSSSFASLTCASVCSYVCDCVCVCVFQFPLFAAVVVVVVFFGGLTVSNAALLAHFVSSFSFLRCNSRGSLSPLFFSRIEQNTYTRAHVQTRTHRRTDGGRKVRAHKTILRFLLLCVIAIIMIGCCCYSLFMGCFLALLINRDRVRYMHTLS